MIKNLTKTILGLLIAGATPAFAQQYQTTLDAGGDEYVNKALVTTDKILLVGASNATPSSGGYELMIMDGNLNGTFNATNIEAGGAGNETARALAEFASGNVTVAGASNSYSTNPANIDDILAVTFNDVGPVWIEVLGTDSIDRCFSVAEGNDGNVIVAGQTKQSDNAKFNAIVAKLDAATGAVIWSKTVGTSYTNEVAYHVQPIQGMGYMIIGYSGVNVMGLNDCMAVLLNEDGTKNAAFIFGGPGDDDARVFIDGGSGIFFIAGNAAGNVGQGNGEAFLARFNASAFPVIVMDWFKTYGGTGSESLAAACNNSSNNGVVLCGSTQSFGNGGDAFAISVDADGVIQWAKTYGGTSADYFQSITEDGSGGFVAAGYSASFGGVQNDAFVVRMDANGSSLCNESTAAFVETNVSSSDAYASFTDVSLADILSADVTLTIRNSSTLGMNQNAITSNTLCTTVSVEENSDANAVSIYPNPAGEILNFNFGVNVINAKALVIYNALGAKVYEASLNNAGSLFSADISKLANGIYTAVVLTNDSQVTAKFTVAK